LPHQHQSDVLEQAIICFQDALQILSSDDQISRNLEVAQDELQQLEHFDGMR